VNKALIEASVALAATLAHENALLAALDLRGAAALLGQKEAAAATFMAVQTGVAAGEPGALDAAERDMAKELGLRLQDLAAENRRLLERAIHVQRRVVGVVAKAVPRAMAGPPRYGATGAMTSVRRPPPVVLSRRA
jgi:hypothetical protein